VGFWAFGLLGFWDFGILGFWDFVIYAGGFGGDAVTSTVLAKIFVAHEYSGTNDFPGTTVSALLSAFSALMVTPTIANVLLPLDLTVSTDIIRDCRASSVPARSFSSWRHTHPQA
jgi:hypothetical protein